MQRNGDYLKTRLRASNIGNTLKSTNFASFFFILNWFFSSIILKFWNKFDPELSLRHLSKNSNKLK